MSIYKTPNVLVIHLKRFSYGGFSGKINKPIEFEMILNVPCSNMSDKDKINNHTINSVNNEKNSNNISNSYSNKENHYKNNNENKNGKTNNQNNNQNNDKNGKNNDNDKTDEKNSKNKKNKYTNEKVDVLSYELIGVVVHHGSSIHSGHYVAFVRVRFSCLLCLLLFDSYCCLRVLYFIIFVYSV